MRTDELTEAMHGTVVASAPDLARIAQHGRRIRTRRQLGAGAVGVCAAVLLATPFVVLQGDQPGGRDHARVTTQPSAFSAARPLGSVLETESKFYFGSDVHSGSLGLEAVWAEPGEAPGRLSFGFRDERTREVLRAGALVVPDLSIRVVDLPALPAQHDEPTYVGLLRLPAGASADRYAVAVEAQSAGRVVAVRQEGHVLPGYLVFTVSAVRELDHAATYLVTNGRDQVVAEGGFREARD
jgi:hypothetical protein